MLRACRRFLLAITIVLLQQTAPVRAQDHSDAIVEGVGPIRLTVADLDRSISFFKDVLTFEVAAQRSSRDASPTDVTAPLVDRRATLRLGEELIELCECKPAGRPVPEDARSNDRSFQHIAIIVSDMDRAYARLQEHHVRSASKDGPQRLPEWNKNAAGIRAFYFRDPDGHFLEVLQFPPDKGDPRWRRKTDRLFLGIDHTAIVVADTEQSLKLYRDVLGFKVVGGSENYGPEQENLNNVPAARLRITTLRAKTGPAIEFLEYLNPRDGRPYPPETAQNDLVYWQTTLVVRDWDAAQKALADQHVQLTDGSTKVLRDPDGHAFQLSSPLRK